MRFKNPANRVIAPGILILSLTGVYLATMAPGVTWANYGSDGGDFITAAATGGVAHPTGYPLYLLLARGFQTLPIGTLAYRTHLLSACAAVLASVFVYFLVEQSLPTSRPRERILGGLIAAYAFGLSPLTWSQAVITEIHTLHVLFVILIIYLSATGSTERISKGALDGMLGLTLGLGMGNHVTIILLLPLIFLSPSGFNSTAAGKGTPSGALIFDLRSLGRRIAWFMAGLLVYLSLPLRAHSNPPINWGNPIDLKGFWWLVSGKLYQDNLFTLPLASIFERLQAVAGLSVDQIGMAGLILGLLGLVIYHPNSPLRPATLWTMGAFLFFSVTYNSDDSFLYLIPALLCLAIWVGIGYIGLAEVLEKRDSRMGWVTGILILVVLFTRTGFHWPRVDASGDIRAEQYGQRIIEEAPARAILIARGDRVVFTTWYFHFGLHERPDLVMIAADLLPFEWYRNSLRSTYPDLNLPNFIPFPEVVIQANPDRTPCFLQETGDLILNCRN